MTWLSSKWKEFVSEFAYAVTTRSTAARQAAKNAEGRMIVSLAEVPDPVDFLFRTVAPLNPILGIRSTPAPLPRLPPVICFFPSYKFKRGGPSGSF